VKNQLNSSDPFFASDAFDEMVIGDLQAPPKVNDAPPKWNAGRTGTTISRGSSRPPEDRSGHKRPEGEQKTFPAPHSSSRAARVRGYRADKRRTHTVYLLGLGVALSALFQTAPVFGRYELAVAPDWARLVLFLALVQLAYAAWMISAPDWSTVRVAMLVLAGVTTIYAMGLAIALMTPPGRATILEMDVVLEPARLWCSAVLLPSALITYVCGRVSDQWRKDCCFSTAEKITGSSTSLW
jgi:hypothetical protein